MRVDTDALAEPVASVLAEYSTFELALEKRELRRHRSLEWFAAQPHDALFPGARDPECAHAGLLLLLGGWEECHHLAQDVDRPAGSYWHGIAHRIEPDFWNSGYWFRRVGLHPIFPDLRDAAAALAESTPGATWRPGDVWDPSAFLKLCESAVQRKASEEVSLAKAIQALEWGLLFRWCARSVPS